MNIFRNKLVPYLIKLVIVINILAYHEIRTLRARNALTVQAPAPE
jgi:hypothetical protein